MVDEDVHAKSRRNLRHAATDAPETNDAQGFALQSGALHALFFPASLFERRIGAADVTGGGKHQCIGHLGDGLCG